jgi:hypothetical protein
MTAIAIDRRIVGRVPERFLVSLGLVATIAGACVLCPELLSRPWLLAGLEIVFFGGSLAVYGLLKSQSRKRRLERETPRALTPEHEHLAALTSHEMRLEMLFRAHEARFGKEYRQIETQRALLEQEWRVLRHKFAHELTKARLVLAEQSTEKYFVFVETSPFSGTLFEEVVEEFGVSVRRVPHDYLTPGNTLELEANEEYVILVMPSSKIGMEQRVVYGFEELATRHEAAYNLSSELLDFPRAWLSSEFVRLVGELFSRIAQTALTTRSAIHRASSGPANHGI